MKLIQLLWLMTAEEDLLPPAVRMEASQIADWEDPYWFVERFCWELSAA